MHIIVSANEMVLCLKRVRWNNQTTGSIAKKMINVGRRKTRKIRNKCSAMLFAIEGLYTYERTRSVIITQPEMLKDSVSSSLHHPGAMHRM